MIAYYNPHEKEMGLRLNYTEMVDLRDSLVQKIELEVTRKIVKQIESFMPRLNNEGGIP